MNEASNLRDLPTHLHRLDNGLTIVVREDHSAPVVAIVTHVKAGYFDEPEPVVGISHVLEHMYFKGTERRGAGDMARETKSAGGYLNAGTIYDHTSYYTVLPSSALELGLDIQSDALLHSEIDEDELRRELLVIIQEAKRRLDNPSAVAQESLYEAMFDVHRMRRWRIGSEAVLSRLTRDDVWRYYRDLYRPSNVVLAVAGDVTADRVIDLAARFYGGMPAAEHVGDGGPHEPVRRGFRFREISGDIARTRLEWGWRTPGPLDADSASLDLLAVVLGQGRACRLYHDVREAGLVATIRAQNYTPRSIGVFDIAAELEPGNTKEALRAIADVIERTRRLAVRPSELDRARNLLERRLIRAQETAEGQAMLLAEWQGLGDWRLLDEYVGRIEAATPEQLRHAAELYLDLDLGTVLVYRPTASRALGIDAESLMNELRAPRAPPSAEPATTSHTEPVANDRSLPPIEPSRIEDGVYFYEVDGVPIVIKPRPTSRLVSMAVCCRGGVINETVGNAGITSLLGRASVKGTTSRSAARLAEQSEALGGVIQPSVSADLLEWSLNVPARHFDAGFDLLADTALAPRLEPAEVERERTNMLADLARVRDDMARYPMRLFLSAAFEGHPYGFSIEDIDAATRRLTAAELAAWHERHVIHGDSWVFVVGGLDPDRTAAAVAPHARRIARRAPSAAPSRPAWPSGERVRDASREKAQTAMVLGFPGPASADPELYALHVLSTAVSGLGGQLFEDLRSRRSLAYTVSVYPLARWLAGAFVGYIATSPAREAEARSRLLEHIITLAQHPLAATEIERAKRYTVGAWQIRGQTNDAQLAELSRALLLDEGLERIRCFEQRINAVTPDSAQAAAAHYLDPARLVEGIVRGSEDS